MKPPKAKQGKSKVFREHIIYQPPITKEGFDVVEKKIGKIGNKINKKGTTKSNT